MVPYKHIYFEPWTGPHYGNGGLWGRKVLIVGESHYDTWATPGCPPCKHKLDRTFTQECVQEIVDGDGGATFWTRVRNRLGGAEHESLSLSAFWNKAAFYNFVQSAVSGQARRRPTAEQWEEAQVAFREAFVRLAPDRVLFVGKQLWSHVPPRDGRLLDIEVKSQRLGLEWFVLEDRHVYVTTIPHTASPKCIRLLAHPLYEFVVRDWGLLPPASIE